MKATTATASSALVAFFIAADSLAFAEAGRTAAPILQRTFGARAAALGEAYVAATDDLNSISYNPAAVATLKSRMAASTFFKGLTDDKFGFLSYGQKLGRAGIAAGALYYDGGEIFLNLSSGLKETRRVEQDAVFFLNLGYPLHEGLTAGVTLKWVQLKLVEEFKETFLAQDYGLLWQIPRTRLSLGGAVQNIGPDVKFEEEGDPLPLTVRIGGAWEIPLDRFYPKSGEKDLGFAPEISFSRLRLFLDGVSVKERPWETHAGLEIGTPPGRTRIALRAGYRSNRDIDSWSMGFGVGTGGLFLDYALGLVRDLNDTHRVSLAFRF